MRLFSSSFRILCLIIFIQAIPSWGQTGNVVRDGIEWLQPLDFSGYSYDQVALVCPNGVCSGFLPGSGINLSGYRWASAEELVSLFNSYGVEPPFSAPFQSREDAHKGSEICGDFDTVFWSPGMGGGPILAGFIRDERPPNEALVSAHQAYVSGVVHCRYFLNPGDEGLFFDYVTPDYIGVWFFKAPDDLPESPPGPWEEDELHLSGQVRTAGGQEICALVLASGQYTFSCNPQGQYSLNNLPTEPDGTVVRQVYAQGFLPKVDVLQGAGPGLVVLDRATGCPDYNLPSDPIANPQSSGTRHSLSGRVLLESTDMPICALVLANGSHVFSCDGTGAFSLEFPLDKNGQYTLQAYADGFAPSVRVFNEFDNPQEVRMARASECNKISEPNTVVADGREWLQPADFLGYSYAQINLVCPEGACTGTLPGSSIDLTGYTWASITEVSDLFNAYGLNPPFTGPYQRREHDPNVNAAIAQDFAVTAGTCFGDCPIGHLFVAGMVRDPAPVAELLYTPYFHYNDDPVLPPRPIDIDFDNTNFAYFGAVLRNEQVGVWLWKPAE